MTTIDRRPIPEPARTGARWAAVVLFLLPALALYAVFVLFPIVQAARYSLFNWNGLTPLTDFVGLGELRARAGRPGLPGRDHPQRPIIVVLSLAIQIPFALGLALMLNRRFRGRGVLRLIFFAPVRHRGGHHRRSSGACSSSPTASPSGS